MGGWEGGGGGNWRERERGCTWGSSVCGEKLYTPFFFSFFLRIASLAPSVSGSAAEVWRCSSQHLTIWRKHLTTDPPLHSSPFIPHPVFPCPLLSSITLPLLHTLLSPPSPPLSSPGTVTSSLFSSKPALLSDQSLRRPFGTNALPQKLPPAFTQPHKEAENLSPPSVLLHTHEQQAVRNQMHDTVSGKL